MKEEENLIRILYERADEFILKSEIFKNYLYDMAIFGRSFITSDEVAEEVLKEMEK